MAYFWEITTYSYKGPLTIFNAMFLHLLRKSQFPLTIESNGKWFLSVRGKLFVRWSENTNTDDRARDLPEEGGAFLWETRRISFHVYKIISICERARIRIREDRGYYVTYISYGAAMRDSYVKSEVSSRMRAAILSRLLMAMRARYRRSSIDGLDG